MSNPGKGGILRSDTAKDKLEHSYSIAGDLRKDVLTDGKDSRGGSEEDDVTDGDVINDEHQPEVS